MGLGIIARVLSFTRAVRNGAKLSDVKLDPGGGPYITGEHFADAGDDSHPLPTDYAAAMSIPRDGGKVPVGYADPINEPKAAAGEKRIYGRNASTGVEVNEVWLKADGAVLIANSAGSFELKADGSIKGLNGSGSFELESGGDFVVNGATITATGDVQTALGRSLDLHVHPITSGSSAPGPTGSPV